MKRKAMESDGKLSESNGKPFGKFWTSTPFKSLTASNKM